MNKTHTIPIARVHERVTVGLIGSGNMANAIVAGFLKSGKKPNEIVVSGRNLKSLVFFADKFGVQTADRNEDCINQSDILIIAVKPQDFPEIVHVLRQKTNPDTIVISIMAGISIEQITNATGISKVVRVMPNIAVRHCKGILVWAASPNILGDE